MPSNEKLAELMLHIARACETDESFGLTKLFKILFFADFRAFATWGRSITGVDYLKLDKGPVPRPGFAVRDELVRTGRAAERVEQRFNYRQKKLFALTEPDLSAFDGNEIAIVDDIVRTLWGKSARDVSDLSHQFSGWNLAKDRETIPYEVACGADEEAEFSDEDIRWAQQVASEL